MGETQFLTQLENEWRDLPITPDKLI